VIIKFLCFISWYKHSEYAVQIQREKRYVKRCDSSTWLWGLGDLSLFLWTASTAAAAVSAVVTVVLAVDIVVVTVVVAVTVKAGVTGAGVTVDVVKATSVTVSDLFYNTNRQSCCYRQ